MAHKRPLRLTLTYALVAAGWIVFSDTLLLRLGLSAEALTEYSLLKGIGFVAVTSTILYLLTDRFARTLERRERDYRDLFELNPNPMYFFDLETLAFLRVNDAAVAKYGYSPEEFAEMKVTDLRPPEDVERLYAYVRAVRSGAAAPATEVGAWRHVTKSGRILWVDVTAHVAEFEGHRALVVLARDLSEVHAAREELMRVQREHMAERDRARWPEPPASD